MDNPDIIMSALVLFSNLLELFSERRYGEMLQIIRKNPRKILNENKYKLEMHSDKSLIKDLFANLKTKYDNSNTLKEYLDFLMENAYISAQTLQNYLINDEYSNFFNAPINEYKNIYEYSKNITVSTQHGVKGESHDSVIFIANDSKTLNISIYEYFKLLSKVEISLPEFENFVYGYSLLYKNIHQFGSESTLKIEEISQHRNEIIDILKLYREQNEHSAYYQELLKDNIDKAINELNEKNINKLKKNMVFSIYQAYKLFYVGCSRARRNLCVLVDKNKIDNIGNDIFKTKMESIGFDVLEL